MMKKFTKLSVILFLLTIAGCRTTKVDYEIVLPPKPQREERPFPKTATELGMLIAYYESLIQSWENWGERVEVIVASEKD